MPRDVSCILRSVSRLPEPRTALALAVAALLAAWAPYRVAVESRQGGQLDVQFNQELEWHARRLAPARPFLARRAGYCFASSPREAAALSASAYSQMRVRALFMAQDALAPTVLVAVLGQPRNGILEPSPENRAAALAGLDALVLDAPASATGCAAPGAAGFELDQAFPGGPALWRRAR